MKSTVLTRPGTSTCTWPISSAAISDPVTPPRLKLPNFHDPIQNPKPIARKRAISGFPRSAETNHSIIGPPPFDSCRRKKCDGRGAPRGRPGQVEGPALTINATPLITFLLIGVENFLKFLRVFGLRQCQHQQDP